MVLKFTAKGRKMLARAKKAQLAVSVSAAGGTKTVKATLKR